MKKKVFAFLLIFIILLTGSLVYTKRTKKVAPLEQIPPMSLSVENENKDWIPTPFQSNPYKLDFVKINAISFAVKEQFLYVRYDLGGVLPKTSKDLPSVDGDKVVGAIYYMTLCDNYFSAAGVKNSGEPQARLEMSFYDYGYSKKVSDPNKVAVSGDLVEGGVGYDYFIAKYNYRQLLLNQTGSDIVFTADSIAASKDFASASSSNFQNTKLMADKNPKEIMIKLEPSDQ